MESNIKAIFATDLAGGFGYKGRLPWQPIREDMQHFRHITHNKHIAMGYRTWMSLPTLPYRTSVVITKKNLDLPYLIAEQDLLNQLTDLDKILEGELVIIGGANILVPEVLDLCDEIYHTTVKGTFYVDVRLSDDSLARLPKRKHEVLIDTPNCIIRRYHEKL